ncbi:hypothetical protein DZ858_00650 [Marixanthomonas ophiurae]|uniref:Uncharacterized protein n=2 Tax=Marixanthomonas ophiurae TaxID=387659 RepID=A0A3E1Q922_9FLAO|nr:hypothetical protein DZ858_00650 [Marixanthomonas ophiurae]
MLLLGCSKEDTVLDTTKQIDFAVESIDFKLTPTNNTSNMVTISGSIINVGDSFFSEGVKQTFYLYERPWGTAINSNGNLIAKKEFSALETGENITIDYLREWNTEMYSNGIFCPSYRLVIRHDSEVDAFPFQDSNPTNNMMERFGSDINLLF